MTRAELIRAKNAMLLANLISNGIGVSVVMFFVSQAEAIRTPVVIDLAKVIDRIFLPCAFIIPLIITLLYERPVRTYLNSLYRHAALSPEMTAAARRRLLNEPFFLIAVDFGIWMVAAALYPFLFWLFDAGKQVVQSTFFLNFYTGLITTTVAFFVFEHVLQRRVVPHFFPKGGLFMTPKTIRIRIRTRLVALLFACNLVPIFAYIRTALDPFLALDEIRRTILNDSFVFIAVGIWVIILVSGNLTRPLREIILVLGNVRNGRFDRRVRVTSNDEIGYTGDVINEMNRGLRERDFIKETFGKYVTSEIRDEILSGKVPLDGEIKEVSVLFADLRDFTPMVESTPPKEVVKILNGYFKEMGESIQKYDGIVLQYIGDEIEAVFGAPVFREDHASKAVKAALEMNRRLGIYNEDLQHRGYPPLMHGIGIHTGEVLAANIGSPERLSYALVGDTVNLASRLQGLNKEFGTETIISRSTRSRLDNGFNLKPLPATKVKGRSREVDIFMIA
jgi:adenylate cyclase